MTAASALASSTPDWALAAAACPLRSLITRAGELGVGHAFAFRSEVDAVNMQRRQRVIQLSRRLVGASFIGRNVAVLGAAFNPDSDDVRDAPALNVAGQIHLQGGHVTGLRSEGDRQRTSALPNVELRPFHA
jgi:UDP-glucose 6-dehydrogenase